MWVLTLLAALAVGFTVEGAGAGAARLICYVDGAKTASFSECTHLVYAGNARGEKLDALLKEYRKDSPHMKIVLRVSEDDKEPRALLKSKHVQGLELQGVHSTLNRTKVLSAVEAARAAIVAAGGGPLFISLPANPELLAKYYDLRALVKIVDLMMVETHDLGKAKKMTYHPSRLSGLWDMMNTEPRALLKSKHVQGLELQGVHSTLNRTKVLSAVEAARAAIVAAGGGPLFISLPANPELLAKYYDLRALVKIVDLMMVETHDLGKAKKMTYHPSRLSGLWDMMNTDSVVDLVIGLGVPASKLVITLPAAAQQFALQNETLSTPGSPALGDGPKEIDQGELCRMLRKGRWTLERDQDLSAPYAFQNKTWIAFEDASSVDVKGKYARVRGLAGLALAGAGRDGATPCGPPLRAALAKVLNQQSRAPRALVLRSLEQEILSAPAHARALDALQVSPYRITQIVDSDGVIHSIREDTRTEFSCSRQGYFVHPRSCARFYRCVKFDQLSPDYTVFEFDCPAGLAFDNRYEVCVWPGSLAHSQACPGSSEIAPVPKTRFVCPDHEGYYADPENCRWFFACLDHGKAPLTAYEFRCPFGLGFDAARLKCDWPWLVPACGNIARYEAHAFGYAGSALSGAASYHGQTADSINIAGHHSLASGAALDNLVGIQGGYLSQADSLDNNFIASQELAGSSGVYQHGSATGLHQTNQASLGNIGLVQATGYNDGLKHTSGSLILDEYRLPSTVHSGHLQQGFGQLSGANGYGKTVQYQAASYSGNDNSGAYVHDSTGDKAEPYRHIEGAGVPYIHDDAGYKQSSDYQDYNQYRESSQGGKYREGSSGQYTQDNSGAYYASGEANGAYKSVDLSGFYNSDDSGKYNNGKEGQYVAGGFQNGESTFYNGAHKSLGHVGSSVNIQQYLGNYGKGDSQYLADSKAYTGGSHTLAAGAVNVGLVGKTTLVDAGYINENIAAHNAYNEEQNAAAQSAYNAAQSVAVQNAYNAAQNDAAQKAYNAAQNAAARNAYNAQQNAAVHNAYNAEQNAAVQNTYNAAQNAQNAYNSAINENIAIQTGYNAAKSYSNSQSVVHQAHNAQLGYVSQPSVAINHLGTDSHNLDGYSYVTTPTTSGVPTTAIPFAVTTAIPPTVAYKTTFLPEPPKTNIKQIFGYSQPAVTLVQPTVVPVKYVTPKIEVTDYNQAVNYQANINQYNAGEAIIKTESSGYDYPKPNIKFEEGISYTTQAPSIQVSTYKPQGFSHETEHNYESVGFGYTTPAPALAVEEPFKKVVAYTTGLPTVTYAEPTVATYVPQSFSQQTIHKVDAAQVNVGSYGYEYNQPDVAYEQPKTVIQYTTPRPESLQPVVSTYQPQVFSQQTLHQVEANKLNDYVENKAQVSYEYQKPQVSYVEEPKTIVEVSTLQPPVAVSSYKPQSFSHQTIHQVKTQSYVPIVSTPQPEDQYHYQEPTYTQQTYHKVDAGLVNTFSQDASGSQGYDYPKPAVKFVEAPKTLVEVSTLQPALASTFKPQTYSHQTVHQVETQNYVPVSSTPAPQVEYKYEQPQVTVYENPILKYAQKTVPVTYEKPITTVYKQSYQPIPQYNVKQAVNNEYETYSQQNYNSQNLQSLGYSYNQPEIQRNVEFNSPSYSLASDVSHQIINHNTGNANYKTANKDVVFVSTTPAKLAYEDHYSEYESPKKEVIYKAQEYIPPKNEYQETYVSSTAAPIEQQEQFASIQHNQGRYDYNEYETRVKQPKRIESYHISSFPGVSVTYKPVAYESPEIQVGYNAEEYLPPVVSTVQSVSTASKEYLPPVSSTPKIYLPPVTSTTPREYLPPVVSTTPREYLPPVKSTTPDIYLPPVTSTTSREYLPPTPTPEYLPPQENTYLPPSTTARPLYKSSTPSTTYEYAESTTFKAPEYLPPQEESQLVNFESFGLRNSDASSKIKYNPYQEFVEVKQRAPVVTSTYAPVTRKQNIVVQNAKANLLGFGTVGPDAGLVSTFSSTPATLSSSEIYDLTPKSVTSSTYAPIEQELVEVTPSPIPRRRTKPKVAVVTKINDFNPLLVRKLGAVCSCQSNSPVLVLKGRRPSVQIQQDYDSDYNSDYDESGRGDIGDYEIVKTGQRSNAPARIQSITVAPVSSTTFNPIIVPDDSYYQDLSDNIGKFENYISSTPAAYSTTERVIKIRPRVKAVTVAPTYKTVILNDVAPSPIVVKEAQESRGAIEAQTFDRYGPGGLRSRDETLQGSVDCQRAGLFRHPKQCNKFYACRWDCTKERFTLHVFNCPVQLSFDPSIGACNWPSQGPACQGDTLLTNSV